MVAFGVRRLQHFQRTSLKKLMGQFKLKFTLSLKTDGEKSVYIWSRWSHKQHSRDAHILKKSSPESLSRLP